MHRKHKPGERVQMRYVLDVVVTWSLRQMAERGGESVSEVVEAMLVHELERFGWRRQDAEREFAASVRAGVEKIPLCYRPQGSDWDRGGYRVVGGGGETGEGDGDGGATGKRLRLGEVAKRIEVHLKRMEKEKVEGLWMPSANQGGGWCSISYRAYGGDVKLRREAAEAYLRWLDRGGTGTHWEMQKQVLNRVS